METKMITIPFDVELAKKITNNEVDGKIVTRDGRCVRIVCWDMKSEDSIVALVQCEFKEIVRSYTADGLLISKYENPSDLMLAIPEYMTFKDGDVIACGWEDNNESSSWISIVKSANYSADGVRTSDYVTFIVKSNNHTDGLLNFDMYTNAGEWARFATEAEKQTMINALKECKEPIAKEYLKRFFGIEAKPEYNFKPFDKVLVRQKDFHLWVARFFDRISDEGKFVCTDSLHYDYCIPYNEKTKHLHSTKEKY